MIPVMIVFGLCFGRWWWTALIAAAVIWPVILLTSHIMAFEWGLVSAAALAVANTGVGILLHQAIRGAVGLIRANRSSP